MADQTEVGLRRAVLVSEQDTHRVAHGTSSGASGEPVWNLVAGKASTPRGSTVDSSHGQESTENGRPPVPKSAHRDNGLTSLADGSSAPVVDTAPTTPGRARHVRPAERRINAFSDITLIGTFSPDGPDDLGQMSHGVRVSRL